MTTLSSTAIDLRDRSRQTAKTTLKFSRLVVALVFGLLISNTGHTHDIDVTGVARLFLDELPGNEYRLSVVDQKVPPLYNLQYSLPAHCTAGQANRYSYSFQCDSPLTQNHRFSFPWQLQGVVLVAQWQDGSNASGYFPGNGTFVDIPLGALKAGAGSLNEVAKRYTVLGAEHILFGIDHLLFVLGLLLLVRGFWKLVKTITAFTVAHSITLACAVLGFIPIPNAPVEVIIALSIVFLAREVVLKNSRELNPSEASLSLVHKRPWVVAFVFGLIHGFGFAGALGNLGLQAGDIPLALLFFNLGVEAGQVAFVIIVLALAAIFNRVAHHLASSAQTLLAYSLGGVATFWFSQRLWPIMAGIAA